MVTTLQASGCRECCDRFLSGVGRGALKTRHEAATFMGCSKEGPGVLPNQSLGTCSPWKEVRGAEGSASEACQLLVASVSKTCISPRHSTQRTG